MKNKVCIKKIIVCFVLIIIVGVQSIDSSYATEWYHAFSPLAVFIDKMAEAKDAQALEDAISLGYSFWRSSPSSNYAVPLSRDTLDELCAELNHAGFPCYVGYRADVYGGAYCIVGNGYLTVSSNSYADREFNISGRVYTNSDGEAYLSYVSYTANDYLGRMDNLLRSIDDHLDNIYYRVTKFYDYITGSPNGASPGVSLYNKLDQVINAVNGISVSGGSFDVTPIVNKLKDIENALANMGSDIDIENNTNININEENENYNIFYVDDPDGGEDKSIVDLSGDTLKVFGKLLDFLYKVSFKGALDNAGSGIGDLSDFYFDTSEGSADLWAS